MPIDTHPNGSLNGYIVFKNKNYYTIISLLNAPCVKGHLPPIPKQIPPAVQTAPSSSAASSSVNHKKVHFGENQVKQFNLEDPPRKVGDD